MSQSSFIGFSDGTTVRTDGPLRMVERRDGVYVCGEGLLVPVWDRDEGKRIIAKINSMRHDARERSN